MTTLDKIKITLIVCFVLIVVLFLEIIQLEKEIENQYNINEYILNRIEAVNYKE